MSYIFLDKISTAPHLPPYTAPSLPSETWRKTLIQPTLIPDLRHTNVDSCFSGLSDYSNSSSSGVDRDQSNPDTSNGVSNARVTLGDGRLSATVKNEISRSVSNLPREGRPALGSNREVRRMDDKDDMVVRDKQKRAVKARMVREREEQRRRRSPSPEKNERELLSPSKIEAMRVVDRGKMSTAVVPRSKSLLSLQQQQQQEKKEQRKKKPFSNSSLFNALLDSQVAGGGGNEKWDLKSVFGGRK